MNERTLHRRFGHCLQQKIAYMCCCHEFESWNKTKKMKYRHGKSSLALSLSFFFVKIYSRKYCFSRTADNIFATNTYVKIYVCKNNRSKSKFANKFSINCSILYHNHIQLKQLLLRNQCTDLLQQFRGLMSIITRPCSENTSLKKTNAASKLMSNLLQAILSTL